MRTILLIVLCLALVFPSTAFSEKDITASQRDSAMVMNAVKEYVEGIYPNAHFHTWNNTIDTDKMDNVGGIVEKTKARYAVIAEFSTYDPDLDETNFHKKVFLLNKKFVVIHTETLE